MYYTLYISEQISKNEIFTLHLFCYSGLCTSIITTHGGYKCVFFCKHSECCWFFVCFSSLHTSTVLIFWPFNLITEVFKGSSCPLSFAFPSSYKSVGGEQSHRVVTACLYLNSKVHCPAFLFLMQLSINSCSKWKYIHESLQNWYVYAKAWYIFKQLFRKTVQPFYLFSSFLLSPAVHRKKCSWFQISHFLPCLWCTLWLPYLAIWLSMVSMQTLLIKAEREYMWNQ